MPSTSSGERGDPHPHPVLSESGSGGLREERRVIPGRCTTCGPPHPAPPPNPQGLFPGDRRAEAQSLPLVSSEFGVVAAETKTLSPVVPSGSSPAWTQRGR
ncbi:hypothetical protein MJG53_002270 [Ovis ammon polii x Ovis aries]|uniref:Uncharacterized protein n=2 Tax=Ovis TaxID=9935 RepID=A0A836D9H6_SHEEP|nr:hypothetical protein JEQ12_000068 [Ovis aries]KAI4580381.1 hypothetical protein MJT46_001749 [Ovis ammon polii x Ovis aries]KAI4591221.1 hypothetical protein MJG53_002270 [Ovis ammon polii x Ovis aries]